MEIRKIIALLRDRSGATAIEYGLMAAFVGVAAIVGLTVSGENLMTIFGGISGDMTAAVAGMD